MDEETRVVMTTRKLACLTGIPNGERKDAWQTLLGIQQDQISLVEFAKNERELDETQARTISTDCERSYFNLDKEKETQKEKRRELERCL